MVVAKENAAPNVTMQVPLKVVEANEVEEDDDNDKQTYFPDVFYVPRKIFETIKVKVEKGQSVTNEEVDSLVNSDPIDAEMYEPVDMKGADENLDNFEEALQKHGPQKTAKCFVQAFETFQKNKHLLPLKQQKVLTVHEYQEMYDLEDDDDDKPMYFPDTFYVPRKSFQVIKAKLENGETVTKEEVDALVNWEPTDKDIYDPVDMKGADEDLDDFEEALEAFGPQKTAQCFIQAFDTFQKNKHMLPPRKQKALTGKQWKDCFQENDEEENAENKDEEEDSEDDESGEEPETKKAKKA